jgi:hypothetical protein
MKRILFALIPLLIPTLANASSSLRFQSFSVPINPAFQGPMQCLVNKLEQRISINRRSCSTGCYAGRPNFSASLHPRGLACDVMQCDRDVTHLSKALNKSEMNSLAASCGVVSGGMWPGPPRPPNRGSDMGHFQIGSYSRARQASYRRHHPIRYKYHHRRRYW